MIEVTEAWKSVQQRFLLPESFIEIDCGITDSEAQSVAQSISTNEAYFSNTASVVGTFETTKYATLELNLWALDGTQTILPSSGAYNNAGYVSNIESTGDVTVKFPSVRTTAVSGVSISWSETFGEYPRVFSVIGKNGDSIVAEVTVTDNTEKTSLVYIPLLNYDTINVVVHDWGLPRRRARIERITIGHVLTFRKNDLLSYTHEMDGDVLSGKIPKYSIEFSLDNSDGRWDPNNPYGMARFLSERQKIVVRYGLDVDGTTEWINGGIYYLSEWSAPPNGLEARFVARDTFEFLLSPDMTGLYTEGNLAAAIMRATIDFLPPGASFEIDPVLSMTADREWNVTSSISAAEIVEKCANAGCCIMRYDRSGVFHIEPLKRTPSVYIPINAETGASGIPLSLSYSYPEISLSKPLKEVTVYYGEDNEGKPLYYTLYASDSGETQSVTNDYIYDSEQAAKVAAWVKDALISRKSIKGEFRADPRLDLYDIVQIEDRYSRLLTVVITNIKYTFNGSFKGSYTGRIIEEG